MIQLTRVENFLSMVIVLIIEAFALIVLSFDLVWFSSLELSMFVVTSFVTIIVVYTATLIVVALWYLKKKKWEFNIKKEKPRKTLLFALALLGLVLIVGNTWAARDLNVVYHIDRNNSDHQYTMINDTHWAFYESGVSNATSDSSTRIVFWLDLDYFSNATYVYFGYYNGTTFLPGENRTDDLGEPNYLWWTDTYTAWYYHPESPFENPFGNTTDKNFIDYTIPKQRANTTVEYALVCRTENNSLRTCFMRGGNYTVLYSQGENDHNSDLITRGHFFTGLTLVLLVANTYLYDNAVRKKPEDYSSERAAAEAAGIIRSSISDSVDSEPAQSIEPSYPSTSDLVHRSDRLDDMKNSHRTISGVFMGLSIGFLLFLQSQNTLYAFLDLMVLGIFCAILANLYCLVVSLSDTMIKGEKGIISYDLLPPVVDENEFRFMVYRRIQRQLFLISRMRQSMQTGVLAILCGIVGDLGTVLLIPWDIMLTSGLAIVIFGFCVITMVVTVVLVTKWMIDALNISYESAIDAL